MMVQNFVDTEMKSESNRDSFQSIPLDETEELNLIRRILRDLDHYGLASGSKIPTPNIVMIGDQSSGKSSLVEAISQIKVPRDTGTCTRVPLEINLTKASGPWTASVSVVQKWKHCEDKKKRAGAPLYPWVEQESPVLQPFLEVNDPERLPLIIRWVSLK
jgi:Dynamin family